MRVFVDERAVTPDRPTLAAAFEAGRRDAAARQRVIVEAKLNGLAMSDAQLDAPSDEPLDSTSDVRFVTAEPRALVRASMLDASDALEELERVLPGIAADLQSGRVGQGLEKLGGALGVWDAVRRVTEEGPSLLGVRTADVRIAHGSAQGPRALTEHVRELHTQLEEVKRALQAQDWSALADVLEGDLADGAVRWRGILREFADVVWAGRASVSGPPASSAPESGV